MNSQFFIYLAIIALVAFLFKDGYLNI